jgi:hypothetical protein
MPESYHDLHITTPQIQRTSIFNLPYGLRVDCTRVTGWELWDVSAGYAKEVLLAGEYAGPEKWLVLDVAGHVILDSRRDDPWTVSLEHRPTCPLDQKPCTSWTCLVDVCVDAKKDDT